MRSLFKHHPVNSANKIPPSGNITAEVIKSNPVKDNNIATRNDNFYAWRCIKALGIDTEDGVVRTSMVHYNSEEDVNKLINALNKI